jgi:HAD superfamily hydrolase (TIGR01509 family)
MLKGILFDMDGVLVDSEEYICKAGMVMFEEKGLNVSPEDFKPFIGMGENRYLGGVAEKYGLDHDIEEIKARTYEIYDELVKGMLQPLKGVTAFIEKCRAKNLKMAVATSADEPKMLINLRELGFSKDDFDALIDGTKVERKKPDPEIYLKAAIAIGLSPAECLVIEDAVSGVKAARSAGSKCVAVMSSFDEKELQEADWVVHDLEQIPDEAIEW